jgi:hypothetical protein
VVSDGSNETGYRSANEAVNCVRAISTNAYLYIDFEVDSGWMRADDLRRDKCLSRPPDPVEKEALRIVEENVRRIHPGRTERLSPDEREAFLEELLDRNPRAREVAKKILESRIAPLEIDVESDRDEAE